MKIHDFPIGPYPKRVRIALAEKGLAAEVTFVKVDLRKGDHKRADFLAKNIAGSVPVLELDDGTLIAECVAITEYLDNLDGRPILTGANAREKGIVHMMTRQAEAQVLDAVSAYFHHATPGLGPDVERDQNQAWGLAQRDKALRGMAYFDEVLQTNRYLAGDVFSMADIALVAGLYFADLVKLPMPTACATLAAWNDRMKTRPSIMHPA